MKREPTLIFNKLERLSSCGNTIFYAKGSVYEKPFNIKYYPDEKHNLDNCVKCQNSYKIVFDTITEFSKKFPYCCDYHSKLASHYLFKKVHFDDLPKMVANKVFYTYHHIQNNIEKDNWKEELKNYIEYAIDSFGQTPQDCGEPVALSKFFDFVIQLLQPSKFDKDVLKYKPRKDYIIKYLKSFSKTEKSSKTDVTLLIGIYDSWYKNFPFDILFFTNLKEQFSKQLPLFSEPPKLNPYTGIASGKAISTEDLLEYLVGITKKILLKIDTTQLLEDNYITNKNKYQLELKKKTHSLAQTTLLKDFSKGEKQYIKAIKKWLSNEQSFIKDIVSNFNLKDTKPVNKTTNNNLSFTYKYYNSQLSQITDLMSALKKHNLIVQETELTDFRAIFKGEGVAVKIVWKGSLGALSYFVKNLNSSGDKITDLNQEIWAVTIKCFKMEDGRELKANKLRTQQIPANAHIIEKCINML